MYLSDNAIYFRFHSIDMKYQVWKVGVVFTDNVSLVASNIYWILLDLFVRTLLFLQRQDKGCHLLQFMGTDNVI